jgi:glycosyltransferase involved in cell wall biosynthesis
MEPTTHSRFAISPLGDPVSICMPVCNEASVIEAVVEEWIDKVFKYLPAGSEFLFDEAASSDGTREILKQLSERYSFINVVSHEHKDGFAKAARRLYERARCPWVFFSDSDGQYVPADFWKLAHFIESSGNSPDMIRGAKIGRKDPFLRRIASLVFNKCAQFLFSIHYLDINSAFFLVRRDALRHILPSVNCMPTLINAELLLRLELDNYRIQQVYVLHRVRVDGMSRGLAPSKFAWHSIAALRGLLRIKDSYRR